MCLKNAPYSELVKIMNIIMSMNGLAETVPCLLLQDTSHQQKMIMKITIMTQPGSGLEKKVPLTIM